MPPPVKPIIYSFAAGELSRDMDGRIDHEKYVFGCRRMENFIPMPHGPAFRRPGLHFVWPAKYADREARLISFDFNSTSSQSYVIEIGHQYMRFYRDGGVILDGETPYEIATPWTEDQIWSVRHLQTADKVYLVRSATALRILTRSGHTAWTLDVMEFKIPGFDLAVADTNSDGKKDGKQNDTFEIADGGVFEDDMIVKGETPGGEERWFRYMGDGFYKAEGAALTVTFKDDPDLEAAEIEAVYNSAGALQSEFWEALHSDSSKPDAWTGTNWPSIIGMFEDRLVLAATPDKPLTYWMSRTGKYNDFRLNTSNGAEPLADDAVEMTLSGDRVNPIRWLQDQEELLCGTNASEVRIWSGTEGEPITPENCQYRRQSANGSGAVPAKLVNNAVLFVSPTGEKVRQLVYDYTEYKYKSPELTLLARHVTRSGIRDWDYAREPDGVLWAALNDGRLVGCTYLKEENVIGWHRHPLGGDGRVESVACVPGQGRDELWLLVRRTVGGTVKRYVETLAPNFLGLDADGAALPDASDAYFVDCGLTYNDPKTITAATCSSPVVITAADHGFENGAVVRIDGVAGMSEINGRRFTAANVTADTFELSGEDGSGYGAYESGGSARKCLSEVAGLDHLEGCEVQALADGAVVRGLTVADGKITLPSPAAKVHVGLGYSSVLQPMRIEVPNQLGTSQAQPKRILAASIRLMDTVGGKICPGDDVAEKYETILPQDLPTPGRPPSLQTADKRMSLASGYDKAGLFTIRQDDPLPMTIICVVPEVAS
ncbi:MAG: ubiquitin-activating E1 FCCH domain-containing protein [Desulfovibrionaceae bacterium]|nr:ubiquitin-activating E1 FCCH domain-containing protein [Desulfovibrionaceae bacterium]